VRWPVWAVVTTPPPVPRTKSGSAYRMYRSILGAHACILLSLGLFASLPWMGHLGWDEPTAMNRALIGAVLLGTAVSVFSRGERMHNLWILGATFVLATPQLGTNPVPNDATVGMVLSAVGVMAARLLPLLDAMGLVAALSAVHVATLEGFGLPGSGLSLDAMVLSLGTAAAAVGFVNAMQASAIATERVTEGNRQRELDLARGEAELRARTTSRRVLHDDVLGTLHLVTDAVAAPDRVRAQARATALAIRRMLGEEAAAVRLEEREPGSVEDLPRDWAALVDDLRERVPATVEVEVVGRAQRLPPLSSAQRAAALRALSEGVRNSVRHGRVGEVVLRISADRRDLRLEVLDRGRGIDVDAPTRSGFGLAESVERPVAEIGGTSALLPRPGGGAVLVLDLPRNPEAGGRLHHAHGLTTGGLGSVRTLSRAVAIPLGAAWCVIAVHSVVKAPESWPSLLVGLAWLALTWVIVRQSERGSPRPVWVATIATASVVLQVLGIVLMPSGAMLDFRSWSIGMSALPLVVFVLSLPFPVAAGVVAAHVLVVLGAPQVSPDLTRGLVPWGSLNAVITCPVPSMVLGSLIRRQGRALRLQQQREFALEHRRAAEEWQVAMTDLYFAHVRHEVLPWLDDVASGARDPRTEETIAQARLLAVAARDDLYAPGFFDDDLRADVAHFRSRGGAVELRAGLVPGGFDRPVGRVLRGLLPVSPGRRIIVSPPVAPEQQVRIAVVPAPHTGDIERLRDVVADGFAADVDAFRAVLLVDDLPGSG
jgi:signal transduction histidine kinase